MYLNTVGRSVTLLLDVPPDATGQLAANDVNRLHELKTKLDEFLNRDIAQGKAAAASNVRGADAQFAASMAVDGDPNTYWTTDDGTTTGLIEIDLGAEAVIDGFIVQEHIALGQRIGDYDIDVKLGDGAWRRVVDGTSMGYKRIDVLGAPVAADRVRLRIGQSDAAPLISNFEVLGVSSLPEPGSAMLLLGAGGLMLLRRRAV